MSPKEARDLLADYIRSVWELADPEAARRFLAPGFVRHTSPTGEPLDLEQQIERLHAFRTAMPDAAVTVEGVAVDGDLIAFRSTLRGTHRGPLLGIPATVRSVTVRLVDMIRIEDGRFAEQWGGPDMLDLVYQLGATITPPEGE